MALGIHFSGLSICLIGAIVAVYSFRRYRRQQQHEIKTDGPFYPDKPKIIPVDPSFVYEKAPFLKFRPFKSKYNLTMGITKPGHRDWSLLEPSYLERINHHKSVFASSESDKTCLCASKTAELAVRELYDYCVSFAVARYPQYFQPRTKAKIVSNTILNTTMPYNSIEAVREGHNGRSLLRILGEHFEEDFLLSEFDPEVEEYRLRACTGIAANGFTWDSKIDYKLTDLHGPIPNYKERLQSSMNRYFRKMTPNDIVQRTTYKVQVSPPDLLFLPKGNNTIDPSISSDSGHCAFMRLERQQLFRMKETKFILFTIRTYMYPLSDIKAEGLGPKMAEAMKAWPDDFATYKHRPEWGEAVFQYLEDPIL